MDQLGELAKIIFIFCAYVIPIYLFFVIDGNLLNHGRILGLALLASILSGYMVFDIMENIREDC